MRAHTLTHTRTHTHSKNTQAEGTPDVETSHLCIPGGGCSLERRYSVPGGSSG